MGASWGSSRYPAVGYVYPIDSIADLRNFGWSLQQNVTVYVDGVGNYETDLSDTSTADNGTSVIVDGYGQRWKIKSWFSNSVSTRSDLSAQDPTGNATVYLTESGREGTFIWSASDHSADVTADPQQGIYVPPTSDTTGASGAWVRQRNPNEVYVEWFLASGFNVATDDATSAFEAAKAAMPNGGTIYVTQGYRINYVHTGNGYVFQGVSPVMYNAVDTICFTAHDPTQYAFQLGDGTTATYGTTFRSIAFLAKAGTEQYGFKINGADTAAFYDFYVRGFLNENGYITSSATQSTTYINFFGGQMICGNNASSNALNVVYGGTYTTAISFYGTEFSYNSNACNKTIILDGVHINFFGGYVQCGDLKGLSLKNGAKAYMYQCPVDSDASTDRLVDIDIASTVGGGVWGYLLGSPQVDGKIYYSDAIAMDARSGDSAPYRSLHSYPAVLGRLQLLKDGATGADIDPANFPQLPAVYADSIGRLVLDVTGSLTDSIVRVNLPNSGTYEVYGSGSAVFSRIIGAGGTVEVYNNSGNALYTLGSGKYHQFNQLAKFPGGHIWESGATASRPASPGTGQAFFDTTLGKPIWYNGTGWVDATGTAV